jgi:hypothetical protein
MWTWFIWKGRKDTQKEEEWMYGRKWRCVLYRNKHVCYVEPKCIQVRFLPCWLSLQGPRVVFIAALWQVESNRCWFWDTLTYRPIRPCFLLLIAYTLLILMSILPHLRYGQRPDNKHNVILRLCTKQVILLPVSRPPPPPPQHLALRNLNILNSFARKRKIIKSVWFSDDCICRVGT